MRASSRSRRHYNIQKILKKLGIDFEQSGASVLVSGFGSLDNAKADEATFCSLRSARDALAAITRTKAISVITNSGARQFLAAKSKKNIIFVDDPRLTFVRVLNFVNGPNRARGISPTAVISDNAMISKNCYVGELSVIGQDCKVGTGTVIHDRVTLRHCEVGARCSIFSGTTIGEDGFSYERKQDHALEKFPHFGRVVIGNDVEINSNCNIARGSLGDSMIGAGTKLDALVHIAHNCKIGKNCLLTAGTIIGGSVTMGDSCWTGLNSTIKHKVTIGHNVIVAAGACVINDVHDGDIVAGVPARSIKGKVKTDRTFMMAGQVSKRRSK